MERQKLTIIKRKGKSGGAGHHGGSWKVAFADFMTAMMAFFLLMWLLSMGPQKKQAELANYFKTFSLFGEGGTVAQQMLTDETSPGNPPQSAQSQAPSPTTNENEGEATQSDVQDTTGVEMDEMKAKLEQEIQERLADAEDQIVIDRFDGGIKIDIMDKIGRPMFKLGSTELTDSAKQIIRVIAENIRQSTHKIEIEGHTDAVRFTSKDTYGNWELSTARASAARIELEKNGLSSTLLSRVSGYADTEPIIEKDPFDPRNRRISLRLLYPRPQTAVETPAPEAQPDTYPPPFHPDTNRPGHNPTHRP